MWSPTHVQVTVYQAKNLIVKGTSGTNDTYVTIKLAGEKYQTSIRERSVDPQWLEECDLPLPEDKGTIHLNAYHRNLLGIDQFLGHADIPLDQFTFYERPRSRWYALKSKPGSKKQEKYRGEIEVKVTFIVQSTSGGQPVTKKGSFKRSASIKTLATSVGEKITTMRWPSKGSLTTSGSKPDLSSGLSEGECSPGPTVRRVAKKDLARSHTILPTSYNNQHLQQQERHHDEVDSIGTKSDRGQDFDRWQNVGQGRDDLHVDSTENACYSSSPDVSTIIDDPLAPFRRKKRSRLSKMNILSQSTHTLNNSSEVARDDLRKEQRDTKLLQHNPVLTKSMFDLSAPSIDGLISEPMETETWKSPLTEADVERTAHGEGHGHFEGQGHPENISIAESDESFLRPMPSSIDESRYEVVGDDSVGASYEERSVDVSYQERSVDASFQERPVDASFQEGSIDVPHQERSIDVPHQERSIDVPHQERSIDVVSRERLDTGTLETDPLPTTSSPIARKYVEKPPKPPRSLASPVKVIEEGRSESRDQVPETQGTETELKHNAQDLDVETPSQRAEGPSGGKVSHNTSAPVSTVTTEETLSIEANSGKTIGTDEKEKPICFIGSDSESDVAASPEISPSKGKEHLDSTCNGQTEREKNGEISQKRNEESVEDRKKKKVPTATLR